MSKAKTGLIFAHLIDIAVTKNNPRVRMHGG